ncbi:MAG TPA: helicase HerA-like domain-containing protein [Sphingomicrobium sp.]|nr:helicase HerA-like domain-containing protein [Sphingomicrobium sp.]
MSETIFIGSEAGGANPQQLELSRANRHGLIAGATGTGKTVTLQGIIEGMSDAGIPTFVADVKGDLAGLALPASADAKTDAPFRQRSADIGYSGWQYRGYPTQFWDLFGSQGHPVRTTISEMGPLLLARLMSLNEVQEGVLTIAFEVADKEGLTLLDLDDLQSMLSEVGQRAEELTLQYGNVSKQSVGAIQRSLLQLRAQGGEHFFGEPALEIADLLGTDDNGKGLVNILAADRLMQSPRLYSTFLLWLLSELFEQLPEVGDLPRPKLCFFFDEAHLLFEDAPAALTAKVEQVVRLIRSKGVGVYFITQNPIDIPDKVAGQLGNRVQHKLNAFTPRDQQAVRSAAETFRTNAAIDVGSAITELKIGEALVSLLQPDGAPSPVQRVLIKPPNSRVGAVTTAERSMLVSSDAVGDKYDQLIDRESAEEILAARATQAAEAAAAAEQAKDAEAAAKAQAKLDDAARREAERAEAKAAREAARPSMADKMLQSATRAAASSIGRQIGTRILRGVLGGMFRGR